VNQDVVEQSSDYCIIHKQSTEHVCKKQYAIENTAVYTSVKDC